MTSLHGYRIAPIGGERRLPNRYKIYLGLKFLLISAI